MSLLYKFVSIVLLILLIGLVATVFVARQELDHLAENQVKQQAKLMMLAALATRDYTEHHIKRLVEKIPQIDEKEFVPETVPAFAATKTLKLIQEDPDFEKYKYREPSQKWTNPDNEAIGYEPQLLMFFREHPEDKDKWKLITDQLGESSWVYARPLIATKDCLPCHKTKEEAPKNMPRSIRQTTASVGMRIKSKRPRSLLYR